VAHGTISLLIERKKILKTQPILNKLGSFKMAYPSNYNLNKTVF